jgi:uncharacterized protein YbaP (TraB family)
MAMTGNHKSSFVIGGMMLALGAVTSAWAYSDKGIMDKIAYSSTRQGSDKTLLWKVERSGLRPSYLFATINSEDPRIAQLPRAAVRAFQLSDVFAMEMIPDHAALLRMNAAMFVGSGPDLKKLLGQGYFNKVAVLMKKYGIAPPLLLKLKPWVVFTALTMPKPDDGVFLDVILYGAALSDGKNVHGLETADEQVSIFEDIPLDDQVAIVKDVVDHHAQLSRINREIVRRYMHGDLNGVASLQDAYLAGDDQRVIRAFRRHVIADRNRRIVNRILPRIEEQNAFIAIDAGLLPGNQGVLQLLRRRGYHISPIH